MRPTARQRQVLWTIATFAREHGYPPSLREMCRALAISSTNGIIDHLKALERKGLVDRDPLVTRGTRLTSDGAVWAAGGPRRRRTKLVIDPLTIRLELL